MEALKCIETNGHSEKWTYGDTYYVTHEGTIINDEGIEEQLNCIWTQGVFFQRLETSSNTSDGSTADYYKLPKDCTEIKDLSNYKNMNYNIGTIFSECFRYGEARHCDELRGAKKIRAYIDFEIERLEALIDAQ